MIGEVLGSYRVLSRLGAGGMGTVWLAEHQLLGSRAAIKVLLPDMSVHPKIVQRFFDEARSASRIQDPGIVRVLDQSAHRRASDILEELLAAVRTWADEPLDDVTIVVLKQLTRPTGRIRAALSALKPGA